MSKITFKFPCGIIAQCHVTGFKGTVVSRQESINGSVQYGLQPRIEKEDSNFVPDGRTIDEANMRVHTIPDDITIRDEDVEFKFACGDRVRNAINGFEGVVTRRQQWSNGCIQYKVEGEMVKTELSGFKANEHIFWEQELEKHSTKKPVRVEGAKRTGGPSEIFRGEGF